MTNKELKYPIGTKVEVRINGEWYPATVYGQAGDYVIARAEGYLYDEYADEHVRPATATEQANIGWNGEGLPPVGWHGEVTWGRKATWHECVMCPGCVAYKHSSGKWVTDKPSALPGFKFRPLRTDRERWVEAAILHEADTIKDMLGSIYDALKSGDLKAPEVE